MKRGTFAIIGLLLASTAMPPAAEARPLLFKMMRGLTAPLGAILGAGHARRHTYHRRASTRHRSPAVAAAPAAAATAATAGTAATTAARRADSETGPSTTGSTSTETAPAEHNAALSQPDNEPQGQAAGTAHAPTASRFGTVGPAAWPTAYEDVIGFTLWPKQYGERLRVHGIGDVLSTAFASSSAIAARTGQAAREARAEVPNQVQSVPGTSVCGGIDLTDADWPLAEIKTTVELDATQNAALEKFRTALSDALGSIKSTCRNDANLSPVERLRAMQSTLWAVHDAAQFVREPLAHFYDSLTDEQKRKFAAPASPRTNARPSRSEMARMCDLPASPDAMRQIEQSIRPTKPQRASFEALQKKAFEMGQFLIASCLKPVPATPAERLDAAADRLTAVIFAASNVNMALNDFTSQLNEEQKARLDSLAR